jgi:hypothetical protein
MANEFPGMPPLTKVDKFLDQIPPPSVSPGSVNVVARNTPDELKVVQKMRPEVRRRLLIGLSLAAALGLGTGVGAWIHKRRKQMNTKKTADLVQKLAFMERLEKWAQEEEGEGRLPLVAAAENVAVPAVYGLGGYLGSKYLGLGEKVGLPDWLVGPALGLGAAMPAARFAKRTAKRLLAPKDRGPSREDLEAQRQYDDQSMQQADLERQSQMLLAQSMAPAYGIPEELPAAYMKQGNLRARLLKRAQQKNLLAPPPETDYHVSDEQAPQVQQQANQYVQKQQQQGMMQQAQQAAVAKQLQGYVQSALPQQKPQKQQQARR